MSTATALAAQDPAVGGGPVTGPHRVHHRDGGRRWQQSSLRLVIPASSLAVPLLDFTDVDHGWLVLGNATWHTADGGRTWTRA